MVRLPSPLGMFLFLQALLAPRPTGLNAMQMAALLRRNQELLLHWMLEQVWSQDSRVDDWVWQVSPWCM